MYRISRLLAIPCIPIAIFSFIILLTGCDQKPETQTASPPLVSVVTAVSKNIPAYIVYPGTIEAVKSVELLARVEGFLISRNFEEGSTVKAGDLLYEIDPKPYQAALKKAEGELFESKAALVDAQLKLERQKPLAEKNFVSRQAFDNFVAKVKELKGQVKADQAVVENANLNLSYCSVYAPFTGRIGYTKVNVGNLVTPDTNPKLARLVQMDPIYVLFQPDGTEITRLAELQNQAPIPVTLLLNDKSEYQQPGKVDSIDNLIDPETNTIKMRAILPNPDNLLIPGEYLKVRVSLGNQENTVLIPQKALDEQQGGYRVFVVDADQTVTARSVTIGPVYKEMQVISEGLQSGEQVVVSGLQKLKSGSKIQREKPPAPKTPAEPKEQLEPASTDSTSTN